MKRFHAAAAIAVALSTAAVAVPAASAQTTPGGPWSQPNQTESLASIRGTLEPSRSAQFDPDFRPAPIARSRWQRVWLAEERGATLPPISVVAVGDSYVLRDGHHRVSVAKARGALTIDALVDAT